MALLPTKSLVFTVRRQEAELVVPCEPTPHECKPLSDIDDQEGHRFHVRGFHFHQSNLSMKGKDPAKVIKEALAKALVFYYPFAGRLREGPNRKLIVDCTGEGVLFIEANADISLVDFGDELYPPFPCAEELLYDVPGSNGLLNSPLLLIQVTRLKCGGFIFAHRFNHTMVDGTGLSQFMIAVGEIALGALVPSTPPVWERHLLSARDSPLITYQHEEYSHNTSGPENGTIIPTDNLVCRSFLFRQSHISSLRRFVPHNLRCSTFDILSACLWRCRTKALELDPNEDVRLICIVNARFKFNPPLPLGYYGNALGFPTASSSIGKLTQNPLEYALKLVKQAKTKVTDEYMKSAMDLLVTRGRANVKLAGSYIVSDLTRAKFKEIDFGWGEAVLVGPETCWELISFYIPSKNKKGEDEIIVPICLPASAMKNFVKELEDMLKDEQTAHADI
ncbi:hypothetical protein ES319_A13G120200v1 [Gossypium barbadense]|uniref:Benzyl alcohol O-benzoyltransferase-like n=1 Tax=Gossypium barbadense TaxID=3634 RepID=A0A5J5SYK1_GOSBA|nr:hypothetical protein ES319_A13G120200v1 [Gossypium barbadense]